MEEPVVSAYHTYRKAEQCENLTQKINLYLQAAKDFLLAAEHLQSSKTSTEVLHNTTNNYSNSNRTSNSDNKSNNCNTNHRNSVSSDDHVERSLVYLSVTATQKAIKYQIMNKKRTNTNTTSKIDEFWKLFLKSNDLSGTLYEGKYNFHKNRKGLQELEKVPKTDKKTILSAVDDMLQLERQLREFGKTVSTNKTSSNSLSSSFLFESYLSSHSTSNLGESYMILDAQKKMNQPKKTSDSTHSSSNDNVKFGGIDDHGDKYKANQPLNTIIESPRSDQNSFKLTENGDLGRGSIREKMSNPSSSKKSVSSSDLSLMHSFKDIRSKNSGRSELSNNSAFDIMMENSQGTWSSSTSAFKEKRLLSIIKDDFSSDWSEKSIPNDIGLLSSTKSYVNLDDSAYQPFLLSESKLVKSYQDLAALSEPTKPKADGLDNSILMTSGIDLLGKSSNFRQEMSDNAEGVLRLLRTVKTLTEENAILAKQAEKVTALEQTNSELQLQIELFKNEYSDKFKNLRKILREFAQQHQLSSSKYEKRKPVEGANDSKDNVDSVNSTNRTSNGNNNANILPEAVVKENLMLKEKNKMAKKRQEELEKAVSALLEKYEELQAGVMEKDVLIGKYAKFYKRLEKDGILKVSNTNKVAVSNVKKFPVVPSSRTGNTSTLQSLQAVPKR